ncbi:MULTISPECIES: hypothetical protein [Arthrobacter]|nr:MULTISPECIES: hypothetical protein [Arthrobacter]
MLTAASLVVMPVLGLAKHRLGARLFAAVAVKEGSAAWKGEDCR